MNANKLQQIRELAEADLYTFAVLVNPNRLYGDMHREGFDFLSKKNAKDDQLLLEPRGHQKSHMIAVWCAWTITRDPTETILYTSATEDLAVSQLYAIKNILTSDVYRRYWPEMCHPEEAKREEWNVKNICVDHPKRKQMGVRDRTVAARSIDANTTGLHASVIVFDDIVVPDNAYTLMGRMSVKAGYSQLSSVLNPGGITKAVGTRYHPDDVYAMMIDMETEEYDDEGNIIASNKTYEIMERTVEEDGQFLWPRTQHPKTRKWYGFDNKELAKIRAKYFASGERTQYYAQYYNNPNAGNEDGSSLQFQYYDRKFLTFEEGKWWFQGQPLSISMGADLAFTNSPTADYTAFAVIGVTPDWDVLVLELDQFRTDKYQKIYDTADRLYQKWRPKKFRIESDGGANLAVEYVKTEARKNGILMAIEGKRAVGEKVERFHMIVAPRYAQNKVFHYRGGIISLYEEQVELARPAHDDIRDSVAIAVEIAVPATPRSRSSENSRGKIVGIHERFGGRIR